MIQDILPHRLRNEYHPDIQPQDNDRVLCFREGKLLLREGQLPTVGSLGRLDYRYLFSVDDAPYFLAASSALPTGCTLQDVRQLRREQSLPKHEIFAILTGKHLADWYRGQRLLRALRHQDEPLPHRARHGLPQLRQDLLPPHYARRDCGREKRG